MFVNPGETIALFNQNKRARFVPPVRMFLFSSFLLFLVVGFLGNEDDSTKPSKMKPDTTKQDSIQMGNENDSTKLLKTKPDTVKDPVLNVNINGVAFSVRVPGDTVIWRRISDNQKNKPKKEIQQAVIDELNGTMIVLLPVFSLLMFFLYWRKRLFYSEFFIFALFFQSQIYFILSFCFILGSIDNYLGHLTASTVPIYLVFTLKRVYQQSWIKTIIKAILLGCLMFLIIIIFMLITELYVAYTL
jgi:hypothetical protein